jgi:hypothetical protein
LRDPLSPQADGEDKDAFSARYRSHVLRLLPTLFDHYGVRWETTLREALAFGSDARPSLTDPSWSVLALCLAMDHVPAFRMPKRSGPSLDPRSLAADVALFVEVQTKAKEGRSVLAVTRMLSRTNHFLKGKNPEHLRQRYYRLLKGTTPESRRMWEIVWKFGQDHPDSERAADSEQADA